jgi:hypothetical protein
LCTAGFILPSSLVNGTTPTWKRIHNFELLERLTICQQFNYKIMSLIIKRKVTSICVSCFSILWVDGKSWKHVTDLIHFTTEQIIMYYYWVSTVVPKHVIRNRNAHKPCGYLRFGCATVTSLFQESPHKTFYKDKKIALVLFKS